MAVESSDHTIETGSNVSRRDFMKLSGAAGIAAGLGTGSAHSAFAAAPSENAAGDNLPGGRYNVLFILTDQEQFRPELLGKGHWPGRDRLAKMGTSFTNHQICAAVCTPSRSVIYTGQHIQHTGMFDNTNFPWTEDMSYDVPTIGHMMREAGYYTTYQGKWHLHDQLHEHFGDDHPLQFIGHDMLDRYGFSDFTGIGDIVGLTLGGYHTDEFVTATAQGWLRRKGATLNSDGQPWCFALNLVNPHDVMFYDTDLPGQEAQSGDKIWGELNREPNDRVYKKHWDVPLAESRHQTWDATGRPAAHLEYQRCREFLVGKIPNEDARWTRLQDYYLNCISDCDRSVDRILQELDNLGMLDNTIVIFTSDHGELCGAHGMSGKGANAFREQNQVPFIIYHPDVHGGRTCPAVTSHVDIVPSILGMTGADEKVSDKVRKNLHGRDISAVLSDPENASLNAVRDAALYSFSMWSYMDADWLGEMVQAQAAGTELTAATAPKPDIRKRSAIRTIYDGKHKFSRYFNMQQHNRPKTMEDLVKVNDLELYDLESDPHEMNNLAVDSKSNGDLLLAMSNTLNRAIEDEVGEDDGRFLPEIEGVNWAFDRFDA
jgi:arylsulfatase